MSSGLAIGTDDEILLFLRALAAAGANSLVLVPMGDPTSSLDRVLKEVVPRL
jgi:hypothetical protein